MRNNKVIRLTESDLREIVQEAVNTILEGQGWKYFKNHIKNLADATPEERKEMERRMRDPQYKYGERAQFVGNGDFNHKENFYKGQERKYYDNQGMPTNSHRGKSINDTLRGRIGRYAGVKGAELATRGVNKFQNWVDSAADPDKNPLSPFSKEGPVTFDED